MSEHDQLVKEATEEMTTSRARAGLPHDATGDAIMARAYLKHLEASRPKEHYFSPETVGELQQEFGPLDNAQLNYLAEYAGRVIPDGKSLVFEWRRLVAVEPGLVGLLELVHGYAGAGEDFCATEVWYGRHSGGIDRALDRLVGWNARSSAIRTSRDYDIAFGVLYSLLPGCKHGPRLGCL